MKKRTNYTRYVNMSLAKALNDLCLLGASLHHHWVLRISKDVNLELAEKIFKLWLDSFRKRYPHVAGIYVKFFNKDDSISFHILLGDWNSGNFDSGSFRIEKEVDSDGELILTQTPISSSEVYAKEIWEKLRRKHSKMDGSFEARELKITVYGNPESELINHLTNPALKNIPEELKPSNGIKFWGLINKAWLDRKPLRENNVERYYEDGTLLWNIGEGCWILFDDAQRFLSKELRDEIEEESKKNPIFTPYEMVSSLIYS